MLRLAFDFIITWRETRTRPNAYTKKISFYVLQHKDKEFVRYDICFTAYF